jgi:beta-phosphoglucomutase-like phosphatase (HAD superfamily)
MTDVLLLDYNGVVVDDEPIHFAALRDVLAIERVAVDEATYDEDYLGLEDRTCIRIAFQRAKRRLDAGSLDRLAARKARWYAEATRTGIPLVPGVQAFVRAAAQVARIAVVSGARRDEISAGLECAGIADVVAAVVSAEDVSAGKPDPAGLRLGLARVARGTTGGVRAAIVEDSLPGIAAARALGAGCVALTTSRDEGTLARADLVWKSFVGHAVAELAPLFREVRVGGGA